MAGKYNLQVDQGSHFSVTLTWRDTDGNLVDLSDWHAKLQVRASKFDDVADPLLEVTDGDGITLGGVDGTITIEFNASQTADLLSGDCVYDLIMTSPDAKKYRLIEGKAVVDPQVTL